jgi:hypothetical protein
VFPSQASLPRNYYYIDLQKFKFLFHK